MTKYKVTGRDTDIEKSTLIVEELNHPDEPVRHIRDIIGQSQKPNGGQNSGHRKFFLHNTKTKERYSECGLVVYFPSKKAAKRTRNHLNRSRGAGAYIIVALDLPKIIAEQNGTLSLVKEEDDLESRFPPFINFQM